MPLLREEREWQRPEISGWLRMALLATDLLFKEAGAPRAHILKLLDDEAPYRYGTAADVSLAGLPGVCAMIPTNPAPEVAQAIVEAINLNFPYGDGNLETATANGAMIRIRVPIQGFSKTANVLSEWPTYGATGIVRHVTPRPFDLVGQPVRRWRNPDIQKRHG